MAAVSGARTGTGSALTVAGAAEGADTGSGATELGRAFRPDWDASRAAQTARKTTRLADRARTDTSRTICGGQKDHPLGQKEEEAARKASVCSLNVDYQGATAYPATTGYGGLLSKVQVKYIRVIRAIRGFSTVVLGNRLSSPVQRRSSRPLRNHAVRGNCQRAIDRGGDPFELADHG